MNKKDLVSNMALEANLTKKDSEAALDAFVTVVENAIANGDKVMLSGFGTWERVERAARTCRNIRTGESISVPAKKAVKFKAGKELKATAES